MRPIIIINFKTYKEATGARAVKLAKICQRVARKTKKNIAVAVQATDIAAVAKAVSIPVFAQHIDPITYGSDTGHTLPEAVRQAGASGTLINHSEDHQEPDEVWKMVAAAKRAKLKTIVCARTAAEARLLARSRPDMIAVEPPELIGGKVSVSTANPHLIDQSVKEVHKVARIPVLTGAGVHNGADVTVSIALGAKGVLVASGVVKSRNPERVLINLAKGL
ncbi:MAG: triose-phosphate isomerase [Candidatus Nanoarchaeia archaeon]